MNSTASVINNLPVFSAFEASKLNEQVDVLLSDCREQLNALLTQGDFTWNALIQPLEDLDVEIGAIWGIAGHLHSVMNSDELREAYNEAQPKITEFYTELGQNRALFEALQTLENSVAYTGLSKEQQRVVENTLRSLKLSGVSLDEEPRKRFAEISKELSELSTKFANNVMDATQSYFLHVVDESRLTGLPDSALEASAAEAKSRDLEGWVFTLDFPSFQPLLTYGEDRGLRETIYQAYSTRASDVGPDAGKFDNAELMGKILELRCEKAKLLNFDNFCEQSVYTKMAESPQEVLGFIDQLINKSSAQSKQEVEELKAFAKSEGFEGNLAVWDSGFYAEKQREKLYNLNQEELRPYFPMEKVLGGMFTIVNKLYGIEIKENKSGVDVWHEDVKFYEVSRAGEVIAGFYLDPYARPKKRGGAWMNGVLSRHRDASGELQLPVCYLVCNFTPPAEGKPGLLKHGEVTTLFHEFGHGLHHMLTKIEIAGIAGVHGVEWDAVELPSQIMENWCWDKTALELISGHYETGEVLPSEKIDQLLAAKNYNSAMGMMRQLEFAKFDFKMHLEAGDENFPGPQGILDEVRKETAPLATPEWNRFQNAFSHIFAGGYCAGYYSYKWAEVLSADAFSLFEEEGIFNEATGKKFLENVLERGGSANAADLFKDFRGRGPSVEALLRHSAIN
jgi:oligopeptidase A